MSKKKEDDKSYSTLHGAITSAMNSLSDEERLEIIRQYCQGCGSTDLKCTCLNDE